MDRLFTFFAGNDGAWQVLDARTVVGEPVPGCERVDVVQGNPGPMPDGTAWVLRGVTSYLRYTTGEEQAALAAIQPVLGRPEACCAALIPIRKSAAWWALPQDQRRDILEDQSQHIRTGMHYLPAVARRLHHSRDLDEPFDFLTWFEFAPADAAAFDDLLAALRASAEWAYVEREAELRLLRIH